jgi:serine protease
MRLSICALAVSTIAAAGMIGGSAEYNPARHRPSAQQQAPVQHVIVKLRSAASTAGGSARVQALSTRDRVTSLASRVGLTLKESRSITDRMHALDLEPAVSGESETATVARLRADSDVEYAEPDQRRYPHAVPNDTLYSRVDASHPGQWYMQNPTTISAPSAVNAEAAWDVTKGSASTGDSTFVIADIDTGVRYDHPDLQGRLLPGYCFISDSFVNNGGTCLGDTVSNAGASDPGDWVTSSDLSKSECSGLTDTQASSWHGTRTAGILGALTNNNSGIAGMAWQGQVLPVRALGKCGGQDSDILSAMLWAAGIAIQGAPSNPTPAKIINMSLGGSGSCPASYQDVIDQITSKGVLVVVSAGNENGPVDAPANCSGVAGVAGLRHAGTKVGYSSFGSQVAISAPAGNCVNTTVTTATPCIYPITSTTNPGTTTPSTAYTSSNAYTDQVNDPNLGTSFSAPLVSGIAALMASVNHNLSSCQLISRLKEGAAAFPTSSADETTQPPACPQTDPSTQECICNAQNCGAGMANASGAVTAALRPIAAVSWPTTVSAGQSVALDASRSTAADGHAINIYQWTSTGSQTLTIENSTSATATVTAPSCGYGTLRLAVTDDAGRQDTADVVLSPTSATSTAPTDATLPSCSRSTPAIMVAVCPVSAEVQTGKAQAFTATVVGASNTSVTWEVNGVAGGNSTVGTISTAGVYTAPSNVPASPTVTITAVSDANTSVTATASVTISAPPDSGGGALDVLTLVLGTFVMTIMAGQRTARQKRAARRAIDTDS